MDNTPADMQDHDESVRIAVKALGDMRNSAHRANSEMVESSVKSISRPVIDRLPVNQLDEFACRQLDRFDRYSRPSEDTTVTLSSQPTSGSSNQNESIPTQSMDHGLQKVKLKSNLSESVALEDNLSRRIANELDESRRAKGKATSWLQASSPFVGPAPAPPDSISSSSSQAPSEERQVAQRSRWQAVLSEASGLSAALSDESLRRLKYCLQWLQYATAHIDAQILILRDFTASLRPLPSQTPAPHPPISQAHLRTLNAVRRDIVHTVKQVVDVVSRYTGGALPEPARRRVRGFILGLPQRWAQKAGVAGPLTQEDDDRERERESVVAASGSGTGPMRRGNRRGRERGPGAGAGSAPSSRATSPMARHTRHHSENGEPVSASTAIVAAQRILTLATESLDMMRGVTGVVKDSLDRADAWVGRFRTVGLQRAPSTTENATGSSSVRDGDPEMELDFSSLRRVLSFSSVADETDSMPSPYSSASSYSSFAGGSSIPPTPGAGTQTPMYAYARGTASPNPMGLRLSSMTLLDSAFGTPKSISEALPDDVDVDDLRAAATGAGGGGGKEHGLENVKIVGMDVAGETEDGARARVGDDAVSGKIDVDM
ncbi:hypothetical protein C0993_002402 [Termitomyces sp. T159_Od127]|nr:hypothetical protein C0993_002402 [Termitomyces sp. T159_Od127]